MLPSTSPLHWNTWSKRHSLIPQYPCICTRCTTLARSGLTYWTALTSSTSDLTTQISLKAKFPCFDKDIGRADVTPLDRAISSTSCRVSNASQGSLVDGASHIESYKYCSPRSLYPNSSHPTTYLLYTTPHKQIQQTTQQQSSCSSPPPSSLSPPALPSSSPKPTLPFAAAELHSAARLMSLILLPSPARTVRAAHVNVSTNVLTTVTAVGAPQTIDEFNAVCADLGVTAQCCVLPIVSRLTHASPLVSLLILLQLGQGLLCASP
jgi:hypothetical protein